MAIGYGRNYMFSLQEENSFKVILKKSCHFLITSYASLIK